MGESAKALGSEDLAVDEVRSREGFDRLEAEWNVLVRETDDQFFYRHEMLRLWLEHFAPESTLRVLTLRDAAGRLEAALPLLEQRAPMYGVPLSQLVVPYNPHSCRFDMVARDAQVAADAFLAHLREDMGWDLLRVAGTPCDGRADALAERALAQGMPVGRWFGARSPYLALPESQDALTAHLGRNLRKNLKRRWRRLRDLGDVEVQRIGGGDGLDRYLDEGFDVEASGWKGERGTAMVQDESVHAFYRELAHTAARQGSLALYFLRVDGRAIAFQFGLEYGGRYLSLKPAYDESLKSYGPGQLLKHAAILDCIERGLTEYDMLGVETAAKQVWTSTTRQHQWLYIFRGGAKGRLLRHAKFNLAPLVGRQLRRWRG